MNLPESVFSQLGNLYPKQDGQMNVASYPPPNYLGDSKARVRVSKACDRCRTHKIKCSGTYPCTTCVKHKRECVYNTTSNNGNKSGEAWLPPPTILNVQTEKELPYVTRSEDKAYIRHLENRIQYLESRFSYDSSSLHLKIRDGEVEQEETDRFVSPSSKWRFSHRSQGFLVEELCKKTYDALSNENREKVQLPRSQYFGWNLSGTHYLANEELPELPEYELPHPIEFYTDFFFKEINQLYAIIHEPVFKKQLEFYLELIKSDKKISHQSKLFEAMLFLIVALAIRFTEFQKKKDFLLELLDLEEKLFWYGYKVINILSFQWESFELIQCWLLISVYLRITHRQTSYFFALGYAVTMAKLMGISRTCTTHRVPGTPYEERKARRIFWSVYILERTFGLQSGRYGLLSPDDMEVDFPSMNFEAESSKDNWITLPSLAMIHIAKLATFVHTSRAEKWDIAKYQQINKEIVDLNKWLNKNGFSNDELFNNPKEQISSLVKAQVKLHFYDLILCVHGKILFNFVGRRIATAGLKLEFVLDSCTNIVSVLTKVQKANLLFMPWHMTLLLLFNIGVDLLVLINAGLHLPTARKLYSQTIELLSCLKKANVRSPDGKVLIKKRFKMAEECLWALRMMSKVITLRFDQDLKILEEAGIEPGSSDVNRATFNQYGYIRDEEDEFNVLMRTGKRRGKQTDETNKKQKTFNDAGPYEVTPELDNNVVTLEGSSNVVQGTGDPQSGSSTELEGVYPFDPSYTKPDNDGMFNNILWFDRWMDSTNAMDSNLMFTGIPSIDMEPKSDAQ